MVLPEIQLSYQTGPTVCCGDSTWAIVVPNPAGQYSIPGRPTPNNSFKGDGSVSKTYAVG